MKKLAVVFILATWLRAIILPIVVLRRTTQQIEDLAIAEDQAWNTLMRGRPDETISARVWRTKNKKWVGIINNLFNDDKHCESSYQSELNRKQLPAEYRVHASGSDHVQLT